MIRLSTIGPPSIRVGETRVSPANHQAFSALLYLTAERGNVIPRKVLREMFFPSRNGKGGHSVRQLLYRLRQLGAAIPADHTTVLLPKEAATWDVEELLLRGVAGEAELAALSRGYLTEFASPRHSEQFNRWLDEHRAQVTAKIRNLLINQVKTERSNRRYPALEKVARACLALDPLNEEATLASAESLAMAGAKAEAVQLLDQYVDEIGPRSADLRVAPRILRGRISEYIADPERGPSAIVGREAEIAILTETLNQSASGSARACIVTGPSGIGKTRLLEEACAMAALSGQAVARVRLHCHDAKRPLAILRDLGPALLDLPGAIGASAEALATVRGLCGRGPSQYPHVPSGAFETQAVVAEVHSRVVDLVDAVVEEQPLVLLVEDAHWIDDASLQLLGDILNHGRAIGVLIASQREISLTFSFGSSPSVTALTLSPLDRHQSRLLLEHLLGRIDSPADASFVETATLAAGGVPFFLNLLYHNYLSTGDPYGIPSTLSESLSARLDQLTDLAKGVFDAVVILGPYSSESRIERVTQHPRYALLQALRRLEEGGFVRVTDNIVAPAHDLLSVAAHTRMPVAVSRLLHRAVAECLESDSQSDIEPLSIAAHWEACREDLRALRVLRKSAEEYSRLGRPREAIDLVERAKQLAHTRETEHDLNVLLLHLCQAAGASVKGFEVSTRLGLYTGSGLPEHQIIALEFAIGAGQRLVPYADQLETIASDTAVSGPIRARASRVLMILAEDLASPTLGEKALRIISDLDDSIWEALMPRLIYETVFGSSDAAVMLAERLRTRAGQAPQISQQVQGLSSAGIAMWRCGKGTLALEYCEAVYLLAKRWKVWSTCTVHASILCDIYWSLGATQEANQWFDIASDHLRSTSSDKGHHYIGIGILLALDRNEPETALALMDEAEGRFPRLKDARLGLERLAYRVRIDLAQGRAPSDLDVEALIAGHLQRRDQGLQDIVADTLIAALQKTGRVSEASLYRDEYIQVFRKDRFPIPPSLTSLRQPPGPMAKE